MFRGYSFAVLAILATALAAGCGSEDADEPDEAPVETAHPVPDLPSGWTVHRNPNAGFAFGVPPGWTARNKGVQTTVRSPDEVVAATFGIDRTNESNEFALDEIAESTFARGIRGIRDLEPGQSRKYPHRYDGVVINATGRANENDVRQKVTLVVLRRGKIATLSVLLNRNAEVDTSAYDEDIRRMIASVRSRPPG